MGQSFSLLALSELRTLGQVIEAHRQDPEFRAEWDARLEIAETQPRLETAALAPRGGGAARRIVVLAVMVTTGQGHAVHRGAPAGPNVRPPGRHCPLGHVTDAAPT